MIFCGVQCGAVLTMPRTIRMQNEDKIFIEWCSFEVKDIVGTTTLCETWCFCLFSVYNAVCKGWLDHDDCESIKYASELSNLAIHNKRYAIRLSHFMHASYTFAEAELLKAQSQYLILAIDFAPKEPPSLYICTTSFLTCQECQWIWLIWVLSFQKCFV